MPFPLQLLVSSDLFQVILESGHREHLLTPAGQISGMIKEMKSARQVVKDMVDQAVRILEEDLPSRVKFES